MTFVAILELDGFVFLAWIASDDSGAGTSAEEAFSPPYVRIWYVNVAKLHRLVTSLFISHHSPTMCGTTR
jgi:hypothetical protein